MSDNASRIFDCKSASDTDLSFADLLEADAVAVCFFCVGFTEVLPLVVVVVPLVVSFVDVFFVLGATSAILKNTCFQNKTNRRRKDN